MHIKGSSVPDRLFASILILGGTFGLAGLLTFAGPAVAQVEPITAGAVMDSVTLKQFVLYAKQDAETYTDVNDYPDYLHKISEIEDWNDGNTFLIGLSPTGFVYFHANDRPVTGENISDVEDAMGNRVVQALLMAGGMEDGGFVAYYGDGNPVLADDTDSTKTAYAVSYTSGTTGQKVILIGGFRQDLSGTDPTVPSLTQDDFLHPEVTAAEVMDRETLNQFPKGSIVAFETALERYGFDTLLENLDVFRQEGSPWRQEHTYLFILTTEGDWFFRGANADLQHTSAWEEQDVNGRKFVQELIAAAQAGGGFVVYHYDDPDVMGDEDTGSPKLSYAEVLEDHRNQNIVGSGLYFDLEDHFGMIELAVDPDVLTEGETTTVTETATRTRAEGALPVSVRMPLAFLGTAVEDTDYTVTGDRVVTIPHEMTEGSTELTFTVAEDDSDESGGETIVVTATHDLEDLASATITVNDRTVPVLEPGDVTAADVMDRATLKSFVRAAASAYTGAIDEAGFEQHGEVVEAFWVEDGVWRLGEIYLFILQTDGVLAFHGANKSLEHTNIFDDQDLNGVYYTRELIAAAQAGGGYVEYYFDNPAVAGDEELGSPKVSYVESVVVDGMELVIGSGFYFDLTGYVPEITLSASPASVTEVDGAQTVTVTATQTSMAIPVTTVIPLDLSGTATEEDYSVSGNLSITIPGEATDGSTQLTITVVNDDVYESGNETIVITASHDGQDLDSAAVEVTDSYAAPSAVGSPPSVTLDAGESEMIDVGSLFNGTNLSYTASSSDNSVAEAVASAASLTLTGVSKGTATVTVAARNAAGDANLAVNVAVTAIAAEREAYENILAAMGRNMLASISTTIGGRFTATGGGRGIALGGRRIDGLASGISALAGLTGHQRQASSRHLELLKDTEHRRSVSSGYLLQSSSFSYALVDHTATGAPRWTVWGAGDWQNFQGEPGSLSSYDGDLKTAYIGFDVAAKRNWMAGIALSHAIGQSDYDVAVASGSLESSLTSVLPYVRWSGDGCCTEVWSILGLGTGEVEVEEATSDLSMRMAMVGMRTRLAAREGLGLDAIGDAGLLRLSTSESESVSLSDITGDVQRIRIGLEGSRSSTLACGTIVTPFAQVAGRYDRGTGQTGQGLEVSGGLRVSGGRMGINAQGRFLAMHTAEGYQENGLSLIAFLRPGAGGQGLSVSVAPRLGSGTSDSGMMWREQPLSGGPGMGGSDSRSLKTEVGYGLSYPSKGLVMTPFSEVYLMGEDQRRMRLGARIGTVARDAGAFTLELSGMRVERRDGKPDHRVGLIGSMGF